MIKREFPTITQANSLVFLTAVILVASSSFFQSRWGLGTSMWINQYIYFLLPALLIAKINGWSVEDMYRFRGTSAKNRVISVFAAISMWFFVSYISRITLIFLNNKVGYSVNSRLFGSSTYQILLLALGTIILAPICEEIFFRGFVQRAYEGRSKRYGFVIAATIFGFYHVCNGVSEVIPATILGLALGYLVYKTDSILTAMLFHAAANICAVFAGRCLLAATMVTVPVGVPSLFYVLQHR